MIACLAITCLCPVIVCLAIACVNTHLEIACLCLVTVCLVIACLAIECVVVFLVIACRVHSDLSFSILVCVNDCDLLASSLSFLHVTLLRGGGVSRCASA